MSDYIFTIRAPDMDISRFDSERDAKAFTRTSLDRGRYAILFIIGPEWLANGGYSGDTSSCIVYHVATTPGTRTHNIHIDAPRTTTHSFIGEQAARTFLQRERSAMSALARSKCRPVLMIAPPTRGDSRGPRQCVVFLQRSAIAAAVQATDNALAGLESTLARMEAMHGPEQARVRMGVHLRRHLVPVLASLAPPPSPAPTSLAEKHEHAAAAANDDTDVLAPAAKRERSSDI